MAELLSTKDAMIWKLLKERESCTSEVEAVSAASTSEIEEWKRYGRVCPHIHYTAHLLHRPRPLPRRSECPRSSTSSSFALFPWS